MIPHFNDILGIDKYYIILISGILYPYNIVYLQINANNDVYSEDI